MLKEFEIMEKLGNVLIICLELYKIINIEKYKI